MAKIRNVVRGAKAEEAGREYEKRLARAHDAYRALGLARIRRLPVPTCPIPGRFRGMAYRLMGQLAPTLRMLESQQGYDFSGVFGPNAGPDNDPGSWHGLSIAMEAKHSDDHRPSLPIIASDLKSQGFGVKEHQLQALAEEYRDYGVASALCWFNGPDALVLTPDAALVAWIRFAAGARRSIPCAEFTKYDSFDYPEWPNVDDWLYPIRIWLERNGRPSPATSTIKAYDMQKYTLTAKQGATQITVENAGGAPILIDNVPPDRAMLDKIARESATPEEMAERVKRLSAAHEQGDDQT